MFSCLSLHITYECKDVHVHTHSNVCIYIYMQIHICKYMYTMDWLCRWISVVCACIHRTKHIQYMNKTDVHGRQECTGRKGGKGAKYFRQKSGCVVWTAWELLALMMPDWRSQMYYEYCFYSMLKQIMSVYPKYLTYDEASLLKECFSDS